MASASYKLDLRVQQVPTFVQPQLNTPESQIREEASDPSSATAIALELTRLQGQAIADSKYDPAIPPPVEAYVDYARPMGLGIIAAALLIGLHMYIRPKCWPSMLFK
jgi:hypothetical protein